MFRVTCLATPLRDKSHETLPNVTYLATAENIARQVVENRCGKWTCSTFGNFVSVSLRSHTSPLPSVNSWEMSRNAMRDKLHETLHCLTAVFLLSSYGVLYL